MEALGIDFAPFDDRVAISLPGKTVGLISKKAAELLSLLSGDGFPSCDLEKLYKKLETFSGVVMRALYNRRHRRGLPLTGCIFLLDAEGQANLQPEDWQQQEQAGPPLDDAKSQSLDRVQLFPERCGQLGATQRAAHAQGRRHLMADAYADARDRRGRWWHPLRPRWVINRLRKASQTATTATDPPRAQRHSLRASCHCRFHQGYA